MTLLEREREIEVLQRAVASAVEGSGSVVVFEAAAGLGKSALLAQTAALGDERGARVRTVRCHELERDLTWNTAREMTGGPAAAGTEPDALYAALRELLETVAQQSAAAPLVLVVDDLHWCDDASLRFLVYLQPRLAELPVSIVAGLRPDERPADDLLAAFTTGPRTELRTLEALSPQAVGAIVRSELWADAPADWCEGVARVTRGNPFYVRELMAASADRDQPPTTEELESFAPASIARTVSARLRRRGEPAERLARAVAVLGDSAPLARAAALAQLAPEEAVAVTDALARAGIFEPGQPLRFVHALVRSAIYGEIPPARRAGDHARAAALLADEDVPDLAAAHLLQAPPVGQPWAITVLEEAARRAVDGGSPGVAGGYLRRALDERSGAADRRRLLIALGSAEAASGSAQAAERFAEAAAATTDPVERAGTLLMLGWTKHHQGLFAEAAREFERGLAELGDRNDELATRLQLGFFTSGSLDASYAPEAHARVARLERELPDEPGPAGRALLAQSLTSRTFAGHPHAELAALAERVWSDGRALREDGPYAETVWATVGFWIWSDDYQRALRATEASLAEARRRGSSLASARGWVARGWARYWTGDLEGAVADERAAIEVWRGGLETYLPAAVYWLVLAQLESGTLDEAEAALDLAGPLRRWEGTAFGVFLIAASARIALARADAAKALEQNELCGEIATKRLGVTNPALLPWRSQAALAALALGQEAAARAHAEDALAHTERFGAPRALGEARRVAALTLPASEAVPLLEQAVATVEGAGAPIEHARTLVELGSAIRRSGRRAEARVHLRRGLELADAHGAHALAAHARSELAATGVRLAPTDASNALTASEERVARLAADGRANREIAAALRVSVKAVEFHLHSTYRKLGIRGRGELPDALGETPGR